MSSSESEEEDMKGRFSAGEWAEFMSRQRVPKRYLDDVLLEYFIVNGYKEVAATLATESGASDRAREALSAMDHRAAIRDAVSKGRMEEAMERIKQVAPDLLKSDTELRFRLLQQQFLEQVRVGDTDAALRIAVEELRDVARTTPKLQRALEGTMAVLAFPDPTTSPVRHLLSLDQRAQTARYINEALLAVTGQPTEARLPTLLKLLARSQKRLRTTVTYPEVVDMSTAHVSGVRTGT